MRRTILAAALGVLLLAQTAAGQPPGPPRYSPTFSPYLNLARGGVSPALNYYGLIRPQLDNRTATQNLQTQVQQNYQSINGLQQGEAGGVSAGPPATGFQAGYMTHLGYFLNNGTGGTRPGQATAGRGAGAGFGRGGSAVGGGGFGGFGAQGAGNPNVRAPARR